VLNGSYDEILIDEADSVQLIKGESREGVSIAADGGGTIKAIEIVGSVISSAGTVSTTFGSKTVTGDGSALFQTNGVLPGHYIQLEVFASGNNLDDQHLYEIKTVDSEAQLTLVEAWKAESETGKSFEITDSPTDITIESISTNFGFGERGIEINRCKRIVVRDFGVTAGGGLFGGIAVKFLNSSDCVLEDSHLYSINIGVQCDSADSIEIRNNTITEVQKAVGMGGCLRVNFLNNKVRSSQGNTDIRSFMSTISGNDFEGHGLLVQFSLNCTITNNRVRQAIGIGINAPFNAECIITDNFVELCTSHGIFVSSAHNICNDNSCTNNGGAGIFFNGVGTVDNNICVLNAVNGITLSAGTAVATGNLCQSNTGHGIELDSGSSTCFVMGNLSFNNSVSAITNNGNANNDIFYNKIVGGNIDHVDTLTAGNGLTDSGSASDPNIAVDYGSSANTAVEGNDSRVLTQDENDACVGTNGTPATANPFVTNSDPRVPSQDENDALVGTNGTPATANPFVTNSDPRVPSQDENDALVGTDGTPSTANPFVTDSDPRLTGVEQLLSTTAAIDLTATGTTNLYTVPASTSTIITKAVLIITADSGITVDAVAGIGIAAGEDDVIAPMTLTQVRVTDDMWIFVMEGNVELALTTEIVKLGVDTGATGTTLTGTLRLYGIEI